MLSEILKSIVLTEIIKLKLNASKHQLLDFVALSKLYVWVVIMSLALHMF